MVPASKSSVRLLLKKMEIHEKNTKGEECVVCLEEFAMKKEPNHEILSMPSSHIFHGVCITRWLETSHIIALFVHLRCP